MSEAGEGRAVPYYCPFCGDEDLRPQEDSPRGWRCGACQRVFAVDFLGIWTGREVTA